jgi:hypothetical protein
LSATVASHRAGVARASSTSADRVLRFVGAVLSFGVYWIHVEDQGGFPGEKDGYMRVGYYALEVAGVLVSIALMSGAGRVLRVAWLLAGGVAAGPLVGYLLTRSTGLPGNTDDKGNWTEPLGLLSVAVEGVLLVVSIMMLRRSRKAD